MNKRWAWRTASEHLGEIRARYRKTPGSRHVDPRREQALPVPQERHADLTKRLAAKQAEKDRYVRLYAQDHISEDELETRASDISCLHRTFHDRIKRWSYNPLRQVFRIYKLILLTTRCKFDIVLQALDNAPASDWSTPGAGPQPTKEATVDASSVAQERAPTTEQEQAHERLLEAAREALAWLRRFERHAPQGARFGGEATVTRRLAEAIRLASYEVRECRDCGGGGTLPGPTVQPMQRPEIIACLSCGGTGRTRVFSYPRPKARRRR
jgi:hypothetical protein